MNDEICTERLARLITEYSLDVREGQWVEINGSSLAGPLIRALYRHMLERGAHPLPRVWLPGLDEIFYSTASEAQLAAVSPVDRLLLEEFDARVTIMSSPNTRALTNVPPERLTRHQTAYRPLFEGMMDRVSRGEFRWCGTAYPTDAYAQDAEMSLREYAEFLYRACGVDREDCVEGWRALSREQAEMIDFFRGKRTVRIVGPDTDLSFSIEGRTFVNCDGRENLPDGEIFTSPVEDSVEGHIRFSYPVCEGGREIEDIRLEFEKGVVVRASAAKNEDYLLRVLDTDEGARRVGEFGIGNNPGVDRFTRAILFDEKIRGTIHLALGLGFPEAGGRNRSAIHWDMICDLRGGGKILADGDLFSRDGEFCRGGRRG
jgi:aminopeptidase